MTGTIVIEGPDGAGKSTLASRLSDRYAKDTGRGALYLHGTAGDWSWHVQALREAAQESPNRLVIIDRHWVSECVYGTVLRDGPSFGVNARSLHRQLLHMGALYVLCAPDAEYIVGQWAGLMKGRAELVQKAGQMRDIATRYVDLLRGSVVRDPQGDLAEQMANQGGVNGHANWFHYDREREREMSPRLPKILLDLARTRFERRNPGPMWGPVTGSPTADVALVGNKMRDTGDVVPFLDASRPTPTFLNDCLHRRPIPEGMLAFVNANDIENDRDLLEALKPFRRLVAMGGKAADRLIAIGRRADVAIRHPAKARMFPAYGDYAVELEEAILGKRPVTTKGDQT